MTKLYFDTETFSEVDVRRVGAHRYAADPSTEILMASWALDDGPAVAEDFVGRGPTAELRDALTDPGVTVVAHHSTFDRKVAHHVWGIEVPIERWLDTAVQAQAHSLPAALGELSKILKLPQDKAKDADGRRLIHKFCKPQPKNRNVRRWTSENAPEDWGRFLEYARLDIESMREAHKALPTWNYPDNEKELSLWFLDQRINDRGFLVDVGLARRAVALSAGEKARFAALMSEATAGAVPKPSSHIKLRAYLKEECGLDLPNMQADTLQRAVAREDTPSLAKWLIEARLESEQTSVAKYASVMESVCPDDRMRGTIRFSGASRTGRWAGERLQPQNLPRPNMNGDDVEALVGAIKQDDIDLMTDDVMSALSDAIRGVIVASEGKILRAADLSNIEGRVLTTLAHEEWKLEFFRDYDAGKIKYDNYQQAYAKSFNVDPSTVGRGTKRQIGKVQELFLGYGGGVGAFVTGAETYNMDLGELAAAVLATSTAAQIEDARGMYKWAKGEGLDRDLPAPIYTACDILKKSWREAHPATVQFWADIELAVIKAIQNPGRVFDAGRYIRARVDNNWLRLRLPSGRYLCYASPRVDRDGVSYMGQNQQSRRWERQRSWGGKFCENVTQAIARDVLAGAMPRAEEAGYEIVLHVHDELLAETPDGGPDHEELARIMARPVECMPDLPLAAAGFSAARYHK